MTIKREPLLVVFGTRPEAIKMAPVIGALKERGVDVRVCVSGQHREMLRQVLDLFAIEPDFDFDLMTSDQTLAGLAARLLQALDLVLADLAPARVLVQGDTLTAHIASLAAFYRRIPVGHVEAGLRTGDIWAPWPEEANRKMISVVTDMHFSPTPASRDHLVTEGVPSGKVWVTGNTVIDALRQVAAQLENDEAARGAVEARLPDIVPGARVVLVTGHRRENFGPAFESLCRGLRRVVAEHPDVELVYPVHLNPNVRGPVQEVLGASAPEIGGRVHLVEPLDYLGFVELMRRAHLIVTDSGGIQEEGPSLGKPVLVMRDVTERPEAVAAGTVKLVGTDEDAIAAEAGRLLTDATAYEAMNGARNPYGDGQAAKRIAGLLMGDDIREWKT